MTNKPLSFSSYSDYMTCPHMFHLKKNMRLRPVESPAYLVFGSAVDAGLNAILTGGDSSKAIEKELKRVLIEPVDFFRVDYDGELVDEATKEQIVRQINKLAGRAVAEDLDILTYGLFGKKEAGETLSKNQRQALALACMASLQAKASLMIQAYTAKVLPLIECVVEVQKEVKWAAADQEFIAIVDLVVKLKDQAGTVALDHKTSSRPYETDAVLSSPQLALYCEALGVTTAGFVVFDKNIRKNRVKTCPTCGRDGTGGRHKTCDAIVEGKRCGGEWTETIRPEASVQILINDMPPRNRQITQEALGEVAKGISVQVFPRNLNACKSMFGRPCPYKKYCWNNDLTGLEVKPEEKKK